jgi:acetyl esterase/lipase
MTAHRRIPLALAAALATTLAGEAPAAGSRSIHDPTTWPIVWAEPGAEQTVSREGIRYATLAGRALHLDMVTPPDPAPPAGRPAVVFLSGFGDDPARPLKSWEIYRTWMRTVAARGVVGVMGETDARDVPGSFAALFAYLADHGGELGIDPARLAVWVCSGNVSGALPFLQSKQAPAGIRAAAILYGAAKVETLRTDLPVLLVVAGRDGPELLEQERALAAQALAARAPWTVLDAPALPHAFDAFDTSEASRAAIAQVLAFLEAHLGKIPAPRAETAATRAAREAFAKLYGRDYEGAHDYFNEVTAEEGPAHRDLDAWLDVAWARRGMGSRIGEVLALEQASKLAPDDLGLRRRFTRAAAQANAWESVEEGLAPLADSPDADAVDLGLLGLARLRLDRPAEAVAPLERAVSLSAPVGTRYNLACAYALAGRSSEALRALENAVDAGFADADLLANDPDLAALRAEPRFEELQRRVAARGDAPANGP